VDAIDKLVRLGFIISGVIAIIIVGSVITLSILAAIYGTDVIKIPSVLENWGGVVVGFYFGTFVSLIKDYIRLKSPTFGEESGNDAVHGKN
jgi:hypothetical protein